MAFREICEIRRQALRAALKVGLGVGAFAALSLVGIAPAVAQLRTGRSTDREFYTPAEPTVSTPPQAKSMRPKAEVVQASATQAIDSAEESIPKRAILNKPSGVRHASHASHANPSSRVVQASCKNCQAGIAHSHGPIAAAPSRVMVDNEDYIDSSEFSQDLHEPNAMVLGSTCQPCMSGCESVGMIQPPHVVGNLLRRMHLRIEAATFWPDGQNLPQLATTRRPPGDPLTAGLIGREDTTNLFGGSKVLGESTQGIRGELGTFFDDSKSHGILLRFFDVSSNSLSYNSTPTSEPAVVRPFFSTEDNAQSTVAVNFPNSTGLMDGTSGSLSANISSDVYGGDILFRRLILRDCAGRLEFLAGYQTARLADSLRIDSTTAQNEPPGTILQISDHFATTNRFNGMALGLNGILRERCWSLSGMVKLGFGNMERSVAIDGSSTITVPGPPLSTSTTANGLLARNTNAGNYVTNTFIVSPETNLTLGYRLTRRLEATVGYSYLGLPKVARVADQLDPQLASNLSNPPTGASTPSFSLRESNYSLHSLDYGLQWRY